MHLMYSTVVHPLMFWSRAASWACAAKCSRCALCAVIRQLCIHSCFLQYSILMCSTDILHCMYSIECILQIPCILYVMHCMCSCILSILQLCILIYSAVFYTYVFYRYLMYSTDIMHFMYSIEYILQIPCMSCILHLMYSTECVLQIPCILCV